MQCRDAQFYLRLRRQAGDELGTDVTGDLDRHLAGCAACAADARTAASFDRAVATAMVAVTVPTGLRDKLLTIASVHRGGVIRRKVYQVAALAASIFFVTGLAFGVFSSSRAEDRPVPIMVEFSDRIYGDPEGALRDWLVAQKFPDQLPEPFDPNLLMSLGTEKVQGKDVPVAVFRHPKDRGFAKVFIFRDDGTYNLKDLTDAQLSHSTARVIKDPARFRGVQYVIVHTFHPDPIDPNPLKPFLRQGRDAGQQLIEANSAKAPGDPSRGFTLRLQFQWPDDGPHSNNGDGR